MNNRPGPLMVDRSAAACRNAASHPGDGSATGVRAGDKGVSGGPDGDIAAFADAGTGPQQIRIRREAELMVSEKIHAAFRSFRKSNGWSFGR